MISFFLQYCDDVWLMFNNAWLYNRKTSRVYKYCTKVRGSWCLFIKATEFFTFWPLLPYCSNNWRLTFTLYIYNFFSGFSSMQNYWETSLACCNLPFNVLNLTVVWGFWTRNWSCNEIIRILLLWKALVYR